MACPQQEKEVCTGRLQQHRRRRYDDHDNDDDDDDNHFFRISKCFEFLGGNELIGCAVFLGDHDFFRVSGHPESFRIVSFSWIARFFFLNFRTPQNFFAFAVSPGYVNFQNLQAPPNRLVYVCMHRKMPMDPMAMPRDPMCECVYICYNI